MAIDSHAHLTFSQLSNDLENVLIRAENAGVERIITVGSGEIEDGNLKAIELTKKYPDKIYATVGIHPHDAAKLKDGWENRLKDLLSNAVGIGEMGLDYHYMNSPKKIQKKVFEIQLQMAIDLNTPATFHVREAYDDFWEIVKKIGLPSCGAIWHCFSGTLRDLELALEMNSYISFAGPITFPKAENLRIAAKNCPIERILVETDCPYLAPQKYRGKTNEPSYVIEVVKKIAELKNISFEETDKKITENTIRAFNLKI